MPWPEVSRVRQREEFVALASVAGANLSVLCRRFGISRKTGYKWLRRAAAGAGLGDRSRRPRHSPASSPAPLEDRVVALRREHPCWGGRKLRRRLQDLGVAAVPAASTITAVLRRHGLLDPAESARHTAFIRFEHPRPNALWQMDFKGHFAHAGGRCHPLTVLDDHSRFAICLAACADERTATVRARLIESFRRYGLPERMTMDNGAPWGDGPGHPFTPLTVWLLRLGIRMSHSRPYHPQTNGKDERFHRTLKAEALHGRWFADLAACQAAFDAFREVYNLHRPHEALGGTVPVRRYRPSPQAYPDRLPPVEYRATDQVRRVQQGGWISFRGQPYHLPKAFVGEPVALRQTEIDGVLAVIFIRQRVAQIDLRRPSADHQPVTHVSEQV